MNLEKFTDRAKGFIQAAQTIALRSNHQQVTPEHLLKALLDDTEGLASGLIRRSGGDPAKALERTERALGKIPAVQGGGAQMYLSQDLSRILDQAQQSAEKAGDSFVTAEFMLLALAVGGSTAEILKDSGTTPQKLNTAIKDLRKGRTADTASAENQYEALKKYAR
ncbi:MAG: ATP-dependent chaperone ClpB, partial [Rhodospirillaceae bacterium]|nr:ATP-dependent chaperone ClpB [Rhodospirillaceae bacterium]